MVMMPCWTSAFSGDAAAARANSIIPNRPIIINAVPRFITHIPILRAIAAELDDVGRCIHAQYRPRRPHYPSRRERNIAGAAAHVQHPHPGAQPRQAQCVFGEVVVQAPLQKQTLYFALGVPKDVRIGIATHALDGKNADPPATSLRTRRYGRIARVA